MKMVMEICQVCEVQQKPDVRSNQNYHLKMNLDCTKPSVCEQTTQEQNDCSNRYQELPIYTENDDKSKILRKRLLYMRHASICSSSKCPISKCDEMKRLMKHIIRCKNDNCSVPKCKSTKYIIIHHRSCRSPICQVCVPVRRIIKHEKRKEEEVLVRQNESSRTIECL